MLSRHLPFAALMITAGLQAGCNTARAQPRFIGNWNPDVSQLKARGITVPGIGDPPPSAKPCMTIRGDHTANYLRVEGTWSMTPAGFAIELAHPGKFLEYVETGDSGSTKAISLQFQYDESLDECKHSAKWATGKQTSIIPFKRAE